MVDVSHQVHGLIERFIGDLGRLGMAPANAARLRVIQGAIRLEGLSDLEDMQSWITRELAAAREAEADGEDDAEDCVRLQ
jgi:hypothetical protein